ncbi:nitroreductase family protein [Deinococcus sp.]|uniref:nitroreductase family protein n=1 Tax=Deinococcus sp. TaxID=47478 RepID=UPI002869930F|nr:nitroreductase family protein [Deinococcus sp.]
MADAAFGPLDFTALPVDEVRARARAAYEELNRRRSVRDFSPQPVPRSVIEHLVLAAGTAPSGAHRQPWYFVAVQDSALKVRIRELVEAEERRTYMERMPDEWREALAPLGTDHVKAHLTDAPWLVIVFREKYGVKPDGTHVKNYYVTESVSIAVGLFIAAAHHAGLATLTHTPNPMTALRELLRRPANEEPLVILPVGYPAAGAQVPVLTRKPLHQIMQVDVP